MTKIEKVVREISDLYDFYQQIPKIKMELLLVIMNAITMKEAKRKLEAIIEKVIADVEPAIIFTESGSQAVLMFLDEFNGWQETAYLLSNPVNAAHLRKSIEELSIGKTVTKKLIE